jgi:hypothetical protein
MFLVDSQTLNVAAPDTSATYWVQPYYLAAGGQLVIDGTYPAARYFSFTTYGANGVPIGDVDLHDTQIVPQPGSVNPYTTPNPPTDPAQLQYSVRVVASPPSSTTDNTLDGLPSGQSSGLGFLVYRLYLPTTPATGGVALPQITATAGPLPACTTSQQDRFNDLLRPVAYALVKANAPDPSQVTRGTDLFRLVAVTAGLFPNPDNQYLAEATNWSPGTVVVIRGKAFTFPNTQNGASVTEPTQLRYWSLCSNLLRLPYPVVQCASDAQTVVNAQGYYLYAISMPQDKPANATAANGVTWLPWATPRQSIGGVPPNTAYLRTMLPAPGFDQAVQAVPMPGPGEPAQQAAADAAAAMGEYYPVGAVCTIKQFETQGPMSCFNLGFIRPAARALPWSFDNWVAKRPPGTQLSRQETDVRIAVDLAVYQGYSSAHSWPRTRSASMASRRCCTIRGRLAGECARLCEAAGRADPGSARYEWQRAESTIVTESDDMQASAYIYRFSAPAHRQNRVFNRATRTWGQVTDIEPSPPPLPHRIGGPRRRRSGAPRCPTGGAAIRRQRPCF